MAKGHNVRPVGHVVHGPDVQVVSCVAADNRRDEGPCAKQSTCQRRYLISCFRIIVGRHELVDRVLRVEDGCFGRQSGVSDEAPIVHTSCEVEG